MKDERIEEIKEKIKPGRAIEVSVESIRCFSEDIAYLLTRIEELENTCLNYAKSLDEFRGDNDSLRKKLEFVELTCVSLDKYKSLLHENESLKEKLSICVEALKFCANSVGMKTDWTMKAQEALTKIEAWKKT